MCQRSTSASRCATMCSTECWVVHAFISSPAQPRPSSEQRHWGSRECRIHALSRPWMRWSLRCSAAAVCLVAGGLVDDTENGELHGTGVACDPQHIGLQAFTNFVGLRSQGRRCHLVWSLVAQACSALEVASCLNDLITGSSALK